jgi:hypothetical protein
MSQSYITIGSENRGDQKQYNDLIEIAVTLREEVEVG